MSLDDRIVGTLRDRLNRPGGYEPITTTTLGAGRHRLSLHYEERLLAGRSHTLPLGPLASARPGRRRGRYTSLRAMSTPSAGGDWTGSKRSKGGPEAANLTFGGSAAAGGPRPNLACEPGST